MSKVDNLKLAGKAFAELGAVIVTVVGNGTNYVADLLVIPKLMKAGQDVAGIVSSVAADLAEIKSLDEAGRTELAAAWSADLPQLANKSVEDILTEGVVVLTYGLEALSFFLRTYAPAAKA